MSAIGISATDSNQNLLTRESESLPSGSALQLATIERLAKQIHGHTDSAQPQEWAKEIERLAHLLLERYKKQAGYSSLPLTS